MKTILVAPSGNPDAMAEMFRAELPDHEVVTAAHAGGPVHYAVVGKPEPGLLAGLEGLELVLSLNAGIEYLLGLGEQPDVPIVRMVDPGLIEGMTEWVAAQVLAWHRNLVVYRDQQAAGVWQQHPELMARERTVTVLGAGALGGPVAATLAALGFRVRTWSRSGRSVAGTQSFGGGDLAQAVSGADPLVNLLPATPGTTNIINAALLARLRATGASEALVHGFKGGETRDVSEIGSIEDMAEADRILKDFTLAKIRTLAQSGKPFFLEHAFMKVHADNFPSKAFKGRSAAKYAYKDSVVEVDAYIGEIVAALDKAGLLENTFIFVTSDNGPQNDSWPDTGYTPFRGAKASAWEGGVRVPGIAYWKGMIAPGRESDELFDLMDLFNTSLAFAGVSPSVLPTDRYFDGIDQSSFLLQDNGKSLREKVYIWNESDLMAMRMWEYKIHTQVAFTESQWLDIDMSTKQKVGLAPWLFNLYIDPKEQYPVGHRQNAWLASMATELKGHAATLRKFPPKDIGLSQ